MRNSRGNRVRAFASSSVTVLALTLLAASSPATANPPADPVPSPALDAEFRERVDAELPGVFNPEREGIVPLAALVPQERLTLRSTVRDRMRPVTT